MSSLILQYPEWSDGDYDVLADDVVRPHHEGMRSPEGTPMAVEADLRLPRGSQTDARLRCMGRRGRRGCAYLLRRLGGRPAVLGAKWDKE